MKVLRIEDSCGTMRDFESFQLEVCRESDGYFYYFVYGICTLSCGRVSKNVVKGFCEIVDHNIPLQMSALVKALDFLDDLNARLASVADSLEQEVKAV